MTGWVLRGQGGERLAWLWLVEVGVGLLLRTCRAVFQVGEPQDCGEERGASGRAEPGVFMKSEDKDPFLGWV